MKEIHRVLKIYNYWKKGIGRSKYDQHKVIVSGRSN